MLRAMFIQLLNLTQHRVISLTVQLELLPLEYSYLFGMSGETMRRSVVYHVFVRYM